MRFLSASDWFKLLIIFMSYPRVRVIQNDSLTSKEVRLKAFSGIEAELRHEEYQGFEEGNFRLTKINGEYQNLFDSRFLKFEKPRRERVLNSGFPEVTVCSARLGIICVCNKYNVKRNVIVWECFRRDFNDKYTEP